MHMSDGQAAYVRRRMLLLLVTTQSNRIIVQSGKSIATTLGDIAPLSTGLPVQGKLPVLENLLRGHRSEVCGRVRP